MAGKPSREDGYAYELPRAENISRISDIIHDTVADTVDGVLIAGIYPGTQFPITLNISDATKFTIGAGHALDSSGNSIRIADTITYPNLNPATGHGTEEGPDWVDDQSPAVATPQSTGAVNVPRITASDTFVLIKYLSVVDLSVEIAYVPGTVHGYTAKLDGYEVVLCNSYASSAAAIASGAIFLGIVTVNGSVVYSGSGLQRTILRTGLSEVKTGEGHSHTGYSLSFLTRFSSFPATAKVRIEVVGGSFDDYIITGSYVGWTSQLLDLQKYAGKSILIYLGSSGDSAYVLWDAIRIVRSRNCKDDSADLYPINYSFEQFTYKGDTITEPEQLDANMPGWSPASLAEDGVAKGWDYIVADSVSGEVGSQHVLCTRAYGSTPTVFGAVVTSEAVSLPTTFTLNGAFSIADGSIPEAKLVDLPSYVKRAGDTMTGGLSIEVAIPESLVPPTALSINGPVEVTKLDLVTHLPMIKSSLDTDGKIQGISLVATGAISGASAVLSGNLSAVTITTSGSITTATSIVVGGLVDGIDVASHRHTGSSGDGLTIQTAGIAPLAVTAEKIAAGTITWDKLVAAVSMRLVPTGSVVEFLGPMAPYGWLFLNGLSIGAAGAVLADIKDKPNAYPQLYLLDLFLHIHQFGNTGLVGGGTKGVGLIGAQYDWDNNRALYLPNFAGRVLMGADNMGGIVRMNVVSGSDAISVGNMAGTETTTLTALQSGLPAHSHSLPWGLYVGRAAEGSEYTVIGGTTATSQAGSLGAVSAHTNLQPYVTVNYIVKL